MKNITLMGLAAGLVFCAWTAGAEDATTKPAPNHEQAAIASEFKVDDARVQGLRDQKLGYGEISKVLALAEKMPGGITDENVKAVVAMRQGPPVQGWGQIAKKQGVTMGSLNGREKNVKAAARLAEKAERQAAREAKQTLEKTDRPAKADKPEKAEKTDKAEKAARAEKMEKIEHAKR
jgi:hypothetical protein